MPPSPDRKQVHWSPVVEEFSAGHTRQSSAGSSSSWQSSSSPPRRGFSGPPPIYQPTSPPPIYQPIASTPPTPLISLPIPLPDVDEDASDSNEQEATASPHFAVLRLDMSLPSSTFRGTLGPHQALLDTPACSPPTTALFLRLDTGLVRAKIEVRSCKAAGAAVTVGDVLTAVHAELRKPDGGGTPAEALPYARQRIIAQGGGGARIVDHLLGKTVLAGLHRQVGQHDRYWQVHLV
ncbi:unnamed protein product [Mycena citricolor]|uniref:DUF6699 domain-containing protein n=1 Tax=Mycena citricolor TaxID=2018698 RepID=A0AAD2Q7D6_9AGAR|nr:unnamed protein product [Mycena citricolor]